MAKIFYYLDDQQLVVYKRFTFGYMYKDSSELCFSPFHYNSNSEASKALEEFLRLCALDGDDIVYSDVLSFDINVSGYLTTHFHNFE